MYEIVYSKQAEKDLERLRRNEPGAHKKAVALLLELMTHPKTGTGHPEQLKGHVADNGVAPSPRNTGSSIKSMITRCMLTSSHHTDTTTTSNQLC